MVKKTAIVFGCGEIFKLHYLLPISCLYESLWLVDPQFKDPEKKANVKALINQKSTKSHLVFLTEFDYTTLASSKSSSESTDVFIFCNHRNHYQLIKKAQFSNGIYVEKPATLEARNYEEVKKLCANNNVNFWPAYHQYYTGLKEIMNIAQVDNRLLNVDRIRIEYIKKKVPVRSWGRSYTSPLLAGGGALLDLGPHVMSLLSIMISDIHYHELSLDKVELKFEPDLSELDIGVNVKGTIEKSIVDARIGYQVSSKEPEKSKQIIFVDLKDGNKMLLDSGRLYINNKEIRMSRPSTQLAFRSMLYDFMEGTIPYYEEQIIWNIRTIESIYSRSNIQNFTDSE